MDSKLVNLIHPSIDTITTSKIDWVIKTILLLHTKYHPIRCIIGIDLLF